MKFFVSVMLVLCMVLAVAGAASAAQGTWKSYATDSLGKLTATDSQSAYITTARGGAETKVNGLEWTLTYNSSDLSTKGVDYSSTVVDGTGTAAWRINDDNSAVPGQNTYNKVYITPTTFDQSRGIVMAKIKRNGGTTGISNGFGFSTSNGYGAQLALRDTGLNIKGGDGNTIGGTYALDTTSNYRVYALSWIGSRLNVWYSNGTDWTSDVSGWTHIQTDFTMGTDFAAKDSTGANIMGLMFLSGSSSNTLDQNIQWMATSTYDNAQGEMTPWDFNPAPIVTPEPGSILALGSGLIGMAGFAIRRRRA